MENGSEFKGTLQGVYRDAFGNTRASIELNTHPPVTLECFVKDLKVASDLILLLGSYRTLLVGTKRDTQGEVEDWLLEVR